MGWFGGARSLADRWLVGSAVAALVAVGLVGCQTQETILGSNPPPPSPPRPDTQPSPPPPPPGEAVCESQGSATCWYIAADGSDANSGAFDSPIRTPQSAVLSAGPGDYIYLRGGTYDLSHAAFVRAGGLTGETYGIGIGGRQNAAVPSGTADALLTLKSYPGERAELRDGFTVELDGKSYWRIQDLTILGGGNLRIGGDGAHNIFVTGNDLGGHRQLGGNNPGIIRVNGGLSTGPYNLFIENNTLHDFLYAACSAGTSGCNDPGSTDRTWDEVRDIFHVGGLTYVGCQTTNAGDPCLVGLVEFRNNLVYNVPTAFFFKRPTAGRIVIENNTIYNVQHMGHWRASNVTFRGNVVYNILAGAGTPTDGLGPQTSFDQGPPESSGANLEFIGNTFVGINRVLEAGTYGNHHTIRDNVFFGLNQTGGGVAYFQNSTGDPVTGNDFDANCFITTSDFVAVDDNGTTYTLDAARSAFDIETTSVIVASSSERAVFANPAAGDYRLIGTAAGECVGKGAL